MPASALAVTAKPCISTPKSQCVSVHTLSGATIVKTNVISIEPQLLCGKLARTIGKYLEADKSVRPSDMLNICEKLLTEIGAEQGADGVWRMEGEEGGIRTSPEAPK